MPKTPDAVDQAIDAVAAEPAARVRAAVAMLNDKTRMAVLDLPFDITDLEVLSLINGILQTTDQLRAQRPQRPEDRLVKATQMPRALHSVGG